MDILPQLLVNGLITGSIYALGAVGLVLSYKILGVLNFAHGHLLMTGGYFFFLFSVLLDYPPLFSIPLTVVCLALLGIITNTVFIAPFARLSPLLPFVTTLAFGIMLESLVSIGFGVDVKSLGAGELGESLALGPIFITQLQIGIIISAFLLLGGLALVMQKTSIGRRLRALSEHPLAAESLGIPFRSIATIVVVVSTIAAGFAGIMIGLETTLQPTMGGVYTIKAFAAMLLGGLGNFWGAVVGSYLLGMIENLSIGLDFGAFSLPAGYKDAFAFVIILLVLLVKPEGLFGKARRRV